MDKIKSMALLSNDLQGIGMIHGIGLVFSQIVSNVPLVVAMLPMMHTAQGDILWLALASASTLAGNATIIGAMANLIVIESAKKEGVHIKFMEFFRSGIIVTVLSFVLSMLVLWLELSLI
jgi:Na+/H+ antiporter NhaD/arsenite permease-like protein